MKEISIIGAGGKMGSWFIDFFSHKKNITLKVFDIDPQSLKSTPNLIVEYTIKDCVKSSDIVILCVPLKITAKMIEKCSKLMKPKSILLDISSIKNKSFKELMNINNKIVPISIHPMFGPGASILKKSKIIFIPVKNCQKEIRIVKKIFPGFQIFEVKDVDLHDRMMGIVLGLTYFINILFIDAIKTENHNDLLTFGGTTFRIQSIISESILNDDPHLICSLLFDNHFFQKELLKFNKRIIEYEKLIKNQNKSKFLKNLTDLKSSAQRSKDLGVSYNKMYKFMNILENSQ
ncbi:MAG: prephenate dehydrogenase/arogenate dehydrogenase family protein [Nitrososphaeraceae archaeon]|nr:prephenate dehydrogenase/arogenate dehydrogenase family protein [Nitrososphaeraceae archaeon]